MRKTLAFKELRETNGIALLALVGFLFATTGAMRIDITSLPNFIRLFEADQFAIPFVTGTFMTSFIFISALLTIALGFRQSLSESVGDNYLFLLHRPITRADIYITKIIVGTGVYLICAAIPILLYAAWSAAPGTHASPFHWSMTLSVWQVWLSMPILYLGAFLSGLRPAWWRGTRLAPLAAAILFVILVQFIPWWWLFGLAAVVLVAVLMIVNIIYVSQERDFS